MRLGIVVSLVLASSLSAAQAPRVPPLAQTFDRILGKAMKDWEVPGLAVGVVESDQVVYLRGFGVRELGKPDPVTPRTVFALASVSKAFCAGTIGLMVDEGKMGWDDPVRRHLGSFALRDPLASQMVTIRDLLNHTTGASRNDALWYRTHWTQKELLDKIPRLPTALPIRTRPLYNNLMYMAAGNAAGAAAGKPWETLVTERLFQPLGMKDTGPDSKSYLKAPDRATPHEKDDKLKNVPMEFLVCDNLGGAGAINSNAADMCQWMRMLLNQGVFEGKTILSEKSLREILRPQVIYGTPSGGVSSAFSNIQSYGMGWSQRDLDGQIMLSHTGRLDGFSTSVTLLPKLKIGIVLLTNSESSMPYAVNTALVDAVLGRKEFPYFEFVKWLQGDSWAKGKRKEAGFLADASKNTKPARKLEDYAGRYTDSLYGTVEVKSANGALTLHWQWFNGTLKHLHYETFYWMQPIGHPEVTALNTATFHYDNKGNIVALNLGGVDGGDMSAIRFVKEKP
jgi:CubicO group peptidase (beta-lactamase class C family)